MILLAAGLASSGLAHAQAPVAGIQPNIDLNATMSASGQGAAQGMAPGSAHSIRLGVPATTTSSDLFGEAPEPDGGWQALAHILQALTPSVNTELPLTPSQITDRINAMLNEGKAEAALDVIQKRIAQEQARGGLGTDVQLMFLHARALSALGRHQEAIELYRHMTVHYPELPEPWNNLAAEYLRQGKLEMARDALQMALTADPGYAAANANLGQVQLMLARQSFDRAARQGNGAARARAQETQALIQK
jgi:tetratricopeptide (TPR) repeat protein